MMSSRKTLKENPRKTPAKALGNDQGEERIQVALRMRPLNKKEANTNRVWRVLPQHNSVEETTITGQPVPENGRTFFTFDKTFGEGANNVDVYETVAKGIVESVVTGLNGTIFAYGQTSSGKTYTMQGSGSIVEGYANGEGGVVHMAANDIFAHVKNTPDRTFLIHASYIEIYNEKVRDLLGDNTILKVREDPKRGVFVSGVEEIVTDYESLLKVLFSGEKNRAVAATGMNKRSSRSHTIFRVTIESRPKIDENDENNMSSSNSLLSSDDEAVLTSTLNLVDLAGSESVRHTGSTGERQKEGGMINQSLSTLSQVIAGLGHPNRTHINFRDSKLTRILQPSLSGNARMAMICCATPSESYLEETRSTLQFASRAKVVKTNAQTNEVLDDRSLIKRLQRELTEARRTNAGPDQLQHLNALETEATNAGVAARDAEKKLDKLKSSILNLAVVFGAPTASEVHTGTENADHNMASTGRTRKRRFSDGDIMIGSTALTTPSRLTSQQASNPLSVPHEHKKLKRVELKGSLSPSSELAIVREAYNAKVKQWEQEKQGVAELTMPVANLSPFDTNTRTNKANDDGDVTTNGASINSSAIIESVKNHSAVTTPPSSDNTEGGPPASTIENNKGGGDAKGCSAVKKTPARSGATINASGDQGNNHDDHNQNESTDAAAQENRTVAAAAVGIQDPSVVAPAPVEEHPANAENQPPPPIAAALLHEADVAVPTPIQPIRPFPLAAAAENQPNQLPWRPPPVLDCIANGVDILPHDTISPFPARLLAEEDLPDRHGLHACPMCGARGLLSSPIESYRDGIYENDDGGRRREVINKNGMSVRAANALSDHAKEGNHAPFWFLKVSYHIKFKQDQGPLSAMVMKLLGNAARDFPLSRDCIHSDEALDISMSVIFSHAFAAASQGRIFDGLVPVYQTDNFNSSTHVKERACDMILEVRRNFLKFDHRKFKAGQPGLDRMSDGLFFQILALFFRRGLFWNPPHPALNGVDLKDVLVMKKTTKSGKVAKSRQKKPKNESTS